MGVACVLWTKTEKGIEILFQRRKKEFGHGLLVHTGGTLENEGAVEGMQREIKEELGANVQFFQKLMFAEDRHANGDPYLMLYFLAYVDRDEVHNMEPGKCYELVWRPLYNLPAQSEMWVNDWIALQAAVEELELD